MRFVDWLDRHNVRLSVAAWLVSVAFQVAAFTVIGGCGGAVDYGDTTPTTAENRCGETGECEGS